MKLKRSSGDEREAFTRNRRGNEADGAAFSKVSASSRPPSAVLLQRTGRRLRESAFTLIEIMIVVVLIGIMTALLVPEMKGTYEDSVLRSTGRDLIDAFKLAYSRSVSMNQPHRVRIDTANARFVVEKQVLERSGETFVPVRDVPGSEGTLDKRVAIVVRKTGALSAEETTSPTTATAPDESAASLPSDITFYPDGTAEGVEILLQDRKGYRLALRVNPTTARVRIVELARQ
jgi:type II secretion system protein H